MPDVSLRQVLVPLAIDPTPAPPGSRLLAVSGSAMGTGWSARLLLPAGPPFDAQAALQAELDAMESSPGWGLTAPLRALNQRRRARAGSRPSR